MTFVYFLEAVLGWTVALALRIPIAIIGLIVVPIGLLFSVYDESKAQPFTQHNTERFWYHVGLPKWLWLWSNDRDGAKGDKRGWWDANVTFGENSDSFVAQFWWMAVRNPANNLRFTPFFSVNLAEYPVQLLAGQEHVDDDDDGSGLGWQFCVVRGSIFKYYSFWYLSQEMPTWLTKVFPSLHEHVFQIRIGHKIKPRYNIEYYNRNGELTEDERHSAWKGFTFRIGFLDYKN